MKCQYVIKANKNILLCFNRKDKMRLVDKVFKMGLMSLGLMLFLLSCSQKKNRNVHRGLYYWKTNVQISNYEQAYMDSLKAQKLYLRFFDVDISPDGKSAKPIAIVNFGSITPKQEIVPVIFITPRGLNAMQWQQLDFYAENIADLLSRKATSVGIDPKEIQIDCDWTIINRDLYFELLKRLREQAFFVGKSLSTTIRLHQIKYPLAAGIPPVDKGLLMVYNIDKLTDVNVENSILNVPSAKKYLDKLGQYQLPLDVALPIFSWTLLFENDQLQGILRDVNHLDLQSKSVFKPLIKGKFQVLKDTIVKGYELKTNQVLRFENSDFDDIDVVSKYLSDNLKTDSLNILLYHCDSINFRNYTTHELEKIFSRFD